MRVVAAIPALALLAGSAFGVLVPDIPFALSVAVVVVCLGVALVGWRRASDALTIIAVVAAFFMGGALLAVRAWQDAWRPPLRAAFEELARRERDRANREGRRLPEDDEASAIVEGTLRADAGVGPTSVSLSVEVEGVKGQEGPEGQEGQEGPEGQEGRVGQNFTSRLSSPPRPSSPVMGGLIVTVAGSLAAEHVDAWRAGRRVRLPVQLRRPSRYLNADVPDFERGLARRGTRLVGSVKSGALVEVIERGGRVDEAIAAVRAFARRAVSQAVGRWSARSAAIVNAIVIGDRAGLDDELVRRLQEAGTYHVMAISGGNIAILAGLLLAGFRVAGVLGRFAMFAAIAVLVAYAELVGGGASVDRATLMAVVYLAGRAADHRSSAFNTLAVVAGSLVVVRPLMVVDTAFVLTFGATLAILSAMPILSGWKLPRAALGPAGLFAASAAAEIVLLPIGALLFSRVTFAGLALNFAAIPLMAITQVAGMAVVPIALVSARAAAVCGYVAHLAATGLVRSADLVAFMPMVIFRVAPPGALVVVLYYAALIAVWIFWRRVRWRRAAVTAAASAAIWIIAEPWTVLSARGDGRLHVTFVDVGQGDAIVVRGPRGSTMVVDTGGLGTSSGFDIGDRVVAPGLRAAGVGRLDLLALSHGDPDHMGGAPSIVREFRPRQIWEGIPVPPFEPLVQLQALARETGASWTNVRDGDHTRWDDVDLFVWHPGLPDWERQRVRNDDSIVLELRWRDVSIVLTGDIGREVERTLLDAIPPAPIRVVKIPHHGSLTSSAPEFVRALKPTVAIVSAGRSNHFGHPVPEVLQRYREAGAEVFRTDQDGAVVVETDGANLSVRSFTGRSFALPRRHEDTK